MSGPDDPSAGTPSTDAPPPKPEMGAVARAIGAFTSPVKTFTDIAKKPSFVLPFVLLTLVAIGASVVVTSKMDMAAVIQQRLERSGQQLTQKQMDQAISMGSKFKWVGTGAAVVIVPIMFLILGLVFWLGLKLSGSDAGFGTTLSATLHGFLPGSIVGGVLQTVVVSRQHSIDPQTIQYLVKSNLGAFLPEHVNAGLRSLASMVDVFNIWTVVLLVIGLSVVGGIDKKKSGVIVVGLWIVYALGKAGIALLRHHVGG